MEKIVKPLCKSIINFLISVGCVALGWNVFLRFAFKGIYDIPFLGFGRLCLLTVAVSYVLQPLGIFVSDRTEQKLNTSLGALLNNFSKD